MSIRMSMTGLVHNARIEASAFRTHASVHYAAMESDAAQSLRNARERAGYTSARSAAMAMGANPNTYQQHESGLRGFPRQAAVRYARFYRIDLAWLLTGKGSMQPRNMVPVVGDVGAGAEVHPIDDHLKGAGLDYIEKPGLDAAAVAVRVKGESMYPFEEGWALVYTRDWDGVPDNCLNRLCIVKLAGDGPTLVKKLRKGASHNLFTLESWNAPPREDVALDWAAPVLQIIPA